MKKATKIMLVAVSMALIVGMAVGGTIAWLIDNTDPLVNTFTPSNIGVEIDETETDFKMTPGVDIDKNPVVTIDNDVDAYLFVKIEKSDNYSIYLEDYVVADGWMSLTGVDGVYYRLVSANPTEDEFAVLSGNKVTVKETVTNADMDLIDGVDADGNAVQAEIDARPTLTFTAYAIQQDGFDTAEAAWAEAIK